MRFIAGSFRLRSDSSTTIPSQAMITPFWPWKAGFSNALGSASDSPLPRVREHQHVWVKFVEETLDVGD
jgi:hypothetical protein